MGTYGNLLYISRNVLMRNILARQNNEYLSVLRDVSPLINLT